MSEIREPNPIEVVINCERCGVEEHYPHLADAPQSAHVIDHPEDIRVKIEELPS